MASTGNAYSVTGWYTPKKYPNRIAADWATGKNTTPDNYTKAELREHYDFCYNEPHPLMRPDKPLPADSDKLRYDWVYNIRQGEGYWKLHNPNGLNADRDGMSPYNWDDAWTNTSSVKRKSATRSVDSEVENQTFNSAFKAAVDKMVATQEANQKRAQEVADYNAGLLSQNLNRNAVVQNKLMELAAKETTRGVSYGNLLSLFDDEEKGAAHPGEVKTA